MSGLLGFDLEEHWRSYESRGLEFARTHDHDLVVLARVLAALQAAGQRATFFVLAGFAERAPGIVRDIVAAGQEVASHGYAHRELGRQTPEEFRADARRSKEVLEQLAGRPVRGYRAAQWSLTPATAWSLDILAELGFAYDSSAFPGRLHRYGWPGMPTRPHRIALAGGRSIIEFPAARCGLGSWSTQVRGGLYWRALPGLVNHRLASGGCWYFHCYDLDAGYELPAGLPWKVRLLKKLGTRRAPARFARLLAGQRFRAHEDALADLP